MPNTINLVAYSILRDKFGFMETWNTIFGGLLAGGVGLVLFFVQNHYREKAEKHKVANALVNEMFCALKFLAAGHKELTRISKKTGSVPVTEISQTYPSRRAIYVTIGLNVGAISEKATEAAVNFDHYIQALERDFDFLVGGISPMSTIDPEIASKLAKKVSSAISLTTKMVQCLADEVGGTQAEETKKNLLELKTLISNGANH